MRRLALILVVALAIFAIFGLQTLFAQTMGDMHMHSLDCVSVCLSSITDDFVDAAPFAFLTAAVLVSVILLARQLPIRHISFARVHVDAQDPRLRFSVVQRE
jgi:hypothetical protein